VSGDRRRGSARRPRPRTRTTVGDQMSAGRKRVCLDCAQTPRRWPQHPAGAGPVLTPALPPSSACPAAQTSIRGQQASSAHSCRDGVWQLGVGPDRDDQAAPSHSAPAGTRAWPTGGSRWCALSTTNTACSPPSPVKPVVVRRAESSGRSAGPSADLGVVAAGRGKRAPNGMTRFPSQCPPPSGRRSERAQQRRTSRRHGRATSVLPTPFGSDQAQRRSSADRPRWPRPGPGGCPAARQPNQSAPPDF